MIVIVVCCFLLLLLLLLCLNWSKWMLLVLLFLDDCHCCLLFFVVIVVVVVPKLVEMNVVSIAVSWWLCLLFVVCCCLEIHPRCSLCSCGRGDRHPRLPAEVQEAGSRHPVGRDPPGAGRGRHALRRLVPCGHHEHCAGDRAEEQEAPAGPGEARGSPGHCGGGHPQPGPPQHRGKAHSSQLSPFSRFSSPWRHYIVGKRHLSLSWAVM